MLGSCIFGDFCFFVRSSRQREAAGQVRTDRQGAFGLGPRTLVIAGYEQCCCEPRTRLCISPVERDSPASERLDLSLLVAQVARLKSGCCIKVSRGERAVASSEAWVEFDRLLKELLSKVVVISGEFG
jgi:hypothetical protein